MAVETERERVRGKVSEAARAGQVPARRLRVLTAEAQAGVAQVREAGARA